MEFDHRHAAAIMLVSGGYPEAYEKSKIISGIENLSDCILFHAGTSKDINTNQVKTSGGRVIAVCSYGNTMEESLTTAYDKAKQIEFEGRYFRTDIGFDL